MYSATSDFLLMMIDLGLNLMAQSNPVWC